MRGEIGRKAWRPRSPSWARPASSPPLPPVERFVDLQYLRAAGLQE
jgi:hypothetical protein